MNTDGKQDEAEGVHLGAKRGREEGIKWNETRDKSDIERRSDRRRVEGREGGLSSK